MTDYRTPDEELADAINRARVRSVINQAVIDAVSLRTAIELDEPPDVVERWINRTWNGLRRLHSEDRLLAIVMLIEDDVCAEAIKVVQSLRTAGGCE